jgi:hypothetical protein
MSEQMVPSAVAQCIIVKFLTIENTKSAEILTRLRAQVSDEMLSGTRCMIGVSYLKKARQAENMQRLHLLQGSYGQHFLGLSINTSYSIF